MYSFCLDQRVYYSHYRVRRGLFPHLQIAVPLIENRGCPASVCNLDTLAAASSKAPYDDTFELRRMVPAIQLEAMLRFQQR